MITDGAAPFVGRAPAVSRRQTAALSATHQHQLVTQEDAMSPRDPQQTGWLPTPQVLISHSAKDERTMQCYG